MHQGAEYMFWSINYTTIFPFVHSWIISAQLPGMLGFNPIQNTHFRQSFENYFLLGIRIRSLFDMKL